MDKKHLIFVVGVSLLVSLLVTFFRGTPPVSTVERVVREVVGASPGPDLFEPIVFQNTRRDSGEVNATNTGLSTNITLALDDLNRYSVLAVRFTGAADTNVTYTLPASTTLNQLVPGVGDSRTICFYNVASSTSAHSLVFAEGTSAGIAIKHASSTPTNLAITDGNTACLTFFAERNSYTDGALGTTSVYLQRWTDGN